MWLCMTMTDGRIGIARERDVAAVAAYPSVGFVRVRFQDGAIDDVTLLTFHYDMRDAMSAMIAMAECAAESGEAEHKRPDEGEGCVYKSADCEECPPAEAKHGDECISGHVDPREPDGFPAPTGDGSRDLDRIEAHMKAEASKRPTYLEMTGIDLRSRANAGDEDAMDEIKRRAEKSAYKFPQNV